jgi:hypothetical protein
MTGALAKRMGWEVIDTVRDHWRGEKRREGRRTLYTEVL